MKGVFAAFIVMFFLVSSCYALNLEVDIYRDIPGRGKTYGDIRAEPGDLIEAYIELKNENQDRDDDDQYIEDIEVELIIEDIDEGRDIVEEYDEFDLKPRKSESLDFKFNIPLRIAEKKYPLRVNIRASENNIDESMSEDFYVDVDKEANKLYIRKLEFAPSGIKCNGISNLELDVLNLGTEDEDVVLKIANPQLDISIQRTFKLEQYPGDDSYQTSMPFKVEQPGIYNFEITMSYDKGRLFLKEDRELKVDCGIKETEEESREISVNNEKSFSGIPGFSDLPPQKDTGEVTVAGSNFRANLFIFVLVCVVIALISLIVVLISKRNH